MAIILCDNCDEWIDDDYHPFEENPANGELTCPNCMDALEEDE